MRIGFMNKVTVLLACLVLSSISVDAQNRHNGAGKSQRTTTITRPASGSRQHASRPTSTGSKRKDHSQGRPVKHGKHDRSDRKNHHDKHQSVNGQRPGAGFGGVRHPGGHRPGGSHHTQPTRPGHRHGFGNGGPHHGWVPPPPRPFTRPVPPRRWRPRPGLPTVGQILGLTFGTALNVSLNYLASRNYAMSGYDNNVVVLTGVPYYNYTWDEGRLLYNAGALYGSQFIYSSPYYDTLRYNSLYNTLSATYGAPVENIRISGGWATTWFGADNGFITLRFEPMMGQNGLTRYYTMLTIGN